MASRRDEIGMSRAELDAFLHEEKVMNVATIGPTGHPHVVAMWYGFHDGMPAFWTFAKSQKVMNLRRDPRMTCLIEAGDTYRELRGAELVGTGVIVDDYDEILRLGMAVAERYSAPGGTSEAARPFLESQARKRVGVKVSIDKVASWDHRKLGGGY